MVKTIYKDLCELTPKEKEIVAYVAKGFDNGAIAEQMGISKETVDTYVWAIYSKYKPEMNFDGRDKRVCLCLLYWGISIE